MCSCCQALEQKPLLLPFSAEFSHEALAATAASVAAVPSPAAPTPSQSDAAESGENKKQQHTLDALFLGMPDPCLLMFANIPSFGRNLLKIQKSLHLLFFSWLLLSFFRKYLTKFARILCLLLSRILFFGIECIYIYIIKT